MTNRIQRLVMLYPTEGGYQKPLTAKLLRETRTMFVVRVEGANYDWKFSKKDMLRAGAMKNEFPRYRIEA
jgi:hypothetical protein